MIKPPLPLNVDHFLNDPKVQAMDTLAVGAYTLLLLRAWSEDPVGTVPTDDRLLSKWTKLGMRQWIDVKHQVMLAWYLEDDRWHQKRMIYEWKKILDVRQRSSMGGTMGMQKRWSKDSGYASLSPQMTKPWLEMYHFFKERCIACGIKDGVGPAFINPEGTRTVDNVQPLCKDCVGCNAYIGKDLRAQKMVGDPKDIWKNEERSISEKTEFAMYTGWEPTLKRMEWVVLNFPKLSPFRIREVIDIDMVSYWTEPDRQDALKTQRGWDMAFGTRLKYLRNKGWLYKDGQTLRGIDAIQENIRKQREALQGSSS